MTVDSALSTISDYRPTEKGNRVPSRRIDLNARLGAESKGMPRLSRGADGLQRESLKAQAAVGVEAPNMCSGGVGIRPAPRCAGRRD